MGGNVTTTVSVTPQSFCITAIKIKWAIEYNKYPMSPMSSTSKHLTPICIFGKNV